MDLALDARERVTVALSMVEVLERQIHGIELSLRRLARHQPGCQALMTQYGVGELVALTCLTELGDVTRMSSSRKAVRFGGLDIGVHRSDKTARVGKLTRQRSSPLRWALYEAGQNAARVQGPDHSEYKALRDRGAWQRLAHGAIRPWRRPLGVSPAAASPAQVPGPRWPRSRRRGRA